MYEAAGVIDFASQGRDAQCMRMLMQLMRD